MTNFFKRNYKIIALVLIVIVVYVAITQAPRGFDLLKNYLNKENKELIEQNKHLLNELEAVKNSYEEALKEIRQEKTEVQEKYEGIIKRYKYENRILKKKMDDISATNYTRAQLDSLARFAKYY